MTVCRWRQWRRRRGWFLYKWGIWNSSWQKQSTPENEYEKDDEELPFSAEQNDSIHTKDNKICIERNNASSIDNDSGSDKDKDDQDEAK